MKTIPVGYKGTANTVVTPEQLAVSVGSGSLRVFATPMLAALMEAAACDAVSAFLENDETTVGTSLEIQHTAATPEGMEVSAEAELISVNGRELEFRVRATDGVGEIGSGTHKRFVVFGEKFQAKAEKRGAHAE